MNARLGLDQLGLSPGKKILATYPQGGRHGRND